MNDVEQIASRLREQGIDVAREEIESRLLLLVEKFHVPDSEARRSVVNYFLKEHGIVPPKMGSAELVKISQIKEANRWVNLEVKVLEIREPTSSAISQVGLVGDETGSIRFVKWAKADLQDLVEGKSYILRNVVTDEFQGRFSIKLNRTSEILEMESQVEAAEIPRTSGEVKISDISGPGQWVDIKGKVVQLWEANSESISQSGLIGDETGVVKFVKWVKAELPDLVEGKSYVLRNVVTDEFQGRFSIKLNRTSEIQETDEEIEVSSQTVTFSGAIVDVQKGSGLIKRCPVCKRSLSKGICGEHGKVEGAYDLRIKAAMDDGEKVQDILINRERTEGLIEMTLDQAREMAMEALDHEVILGIIEEKLVGRYYMATGPRIDRYLLVERIEEMAPATLAEVEGLLKEVA